MEMFAALSVGVLVLTALFIAVKTLLLWRRTRGLPELLLATMLFTATVLGYPLAIVSTKLAADRLWGIHVGSQLLFSVGYACLLLFTLRVFRPTELWAKGFAGVTLLVFAVGTVYYLIEMTSAHPRKPNEMLGLTLLSSTAIGAVYFWTTIESLLYYRQLRLRLRLGLTDAVVANRVLLWGMMGLAAGLAVIISSAAMLEGSFMSPAIVSVCSALGLVHAGSLFFAFHPPAWYRSWLLQGSAAAAGSN